MADETLRSIRALPNAERRREEEWRWNCQRARKGAALAFIWRDGWRHIDPTRDSRLEQIVFALSLGVDLSWNGVCQAGHTSHGLPHNPRADRAHLLNCKVHIKNQRHDAVRDQLAAILRKLHQGKPVTVMREVDIAASGRMFEIRNRREGQYVPGDVGVQWVGSKAMLVDVTVQSATTRVPTRAQHPAAPRAAQKMKQFSERGYQGRAALVPFALTTYGAVYPAAHRKMRAMLGGGLEGGVLVQQAVLAGMLAHAAGVVELQPPWLPRPVQ